VERLEDKADALDERMLEERVKSTRALIQTFLQTVKAYRLYESNHPILSKFLDRLRKDFDHYFHEFDSFSLQIAEHHLYYQGKVVYESQDVKESLAFLFFKDGIRELRFFKGLEFKEIVDFLNIVRKSDLVNRLEDDLVTLLWEKDFFHIAFTTVDEFLEGRSSFVPATEEDLKNGLEHRGYWDEGIDEITGERGAEGSHVLLVEDLRQALNPPPGQSLVQACQLNPDEMETIRQEIQQEQQPGYTYLLVNNLIEILLHLGEDVDAYENMISYFDRVIESLLEQKEVGMAAAILKNLSDTIESMVLKDKQIFAIRRILGNASRPPFVELLGDAMKSNGEVESDSIHQYLQFLTKQAVDPLCHLLGELESGKWRKAVCDHVAELSQADIQPLIKFLSDQNSFLVCHILYILEKIGHPSTLKYLVNLVAHEDPMVRKETLQVVNKFGEEGVDLIQRFLKDPVPDIRGKASLALAKIAKGEAVKSLSEIILSKDFYKRDYQEKASFFRALGEIGSGEVIPILKKIAKKRRWFKKAKWDEVRLCAANALKMMGAAEVRNPIKAKENSDQSSDPFIKE
jgi:HEAT repeat protein